MSTSPSATAPAKSIPLSVARFCDLTLGVLLRTIDPIVRAPAVAPVSVLPTPDGSMLVQTQRQTQTITTLQHSDKMLPGKCNFPSEIHIPAKLDFKNPTFVMPIRVTNRAAHDFKVDRGYNWFAGI